LLRRLWGLPIGIHAVVLAVALLSVLPIVGTRSVVFSDEGAALIQARQLARGDGWITPYAFTKIDKAEVGYPLAVADSGRDGRAAYAKHPAYPVLLAAADRIGGNAAILVLSILGTVLAALFAGLLAMRWSPTVARPTVWMVGLASPLIFDSYLVVAHTLGAAAATMAVYFAFRFLDAPRRYGAAIVAVSATLACAALRTEGVLFAGVLGATIAGLGLIRRRVSFIALGSAIAASGAVVRLLEPKLLNHLIGASKSVVERVSVERHGLFIDAWRGFIRTWISPNYAGPNDRYVVVVLLLVLAIFGVLVAKRRPSDSHGIALLAVLAIGFSVSLNFLQAGLVPGLVFAFPVLFAGLAVLRRDALREMTPMLLIIIAAAFSAAVLAPQYGVGGSVVWGGRYFAIGVPLVCPVALDSLRRVGHQLGNTPRVVGMVGLVAISLAFCVGAIRTARDLHVATDRLVTTTTTLSRGTPAGDGGDPVIMTDDQYLAKASWSIFDHRRFIWLASEDLGKYLARMRHSGITRLVVATRNPKVKLRDLRGSYSTVKVVHLETNSVWEFVVLEAS